MIISNLVMKLRRKKVVEPYELWDVNGTNSAIANEGKSKSIKKSSHPSSRRTKGVAIPHPGQSYNPHPDDHDKLLKKIAQKELAEQKKAKALGKEKKVDKKELEDHENEQLVAGLEHLIKTDSDKKDDDDETSSAYSEYDEKDFEAILKDKTVQEKRKTRQQRLGQLRDRLIRRAAKLRKLKNIRGSKFDSIKKMIKQLNKDEKLREESLTKKRKHRKVRNERLCQRFEPADPIYCVKSELPTSLREIKSPMDAIVREQLDSFKAKLMVEPTTYQKKRPKYKKPVFERKAASERD